MTSIKQQGTPMTKEAAGDAYYSSFENKYIIMDNLSDKYSAEIADRPVVYNSDYVYVTVVVEGQLNVNVGNVDLEIKAGEYLAVMPCMSVKVYESRCRYFTFLTQGYLMTDIYEHTSLGEKVKIRAFCHRHYVLGDSTVQMLLRCYQHVKREHERPDYPLKEIVFRSLQTAYVAQLFSFIDPEGYLRLEKNSRQMQFYNMFLESLGDNHKKQRSVQFYANALRITPKYLSTISQTFTGLSASQVIDQYVIYAIKQTLYTNKDNIKTVSEQYNFPSQSFFGRYFKRVTGLSPNEYIKQYNRKSLSFDKNV